MLKSRQDAHGHLVRDLFRGIDATEIGERDDGWIATTPGPSLYLAPFRSWPKHERQAMRFVRGRVLDVGCGAGRAALYLQQRGQEVVGIDVSPLAVDTARRRGVRDARVMSVTRISARLGSFDTVLMLGNNFGLMENGTRARWLLRKLARVTSPRGRLVASVVDPYDTKDPAHLRYHRRNRRRGRMGGQVRLRVRYGPYCTPWFDWLLVSRDEMRALLKPTPWQVERFIGGDGALYTAVLGKGS